MPKVSVVIPLYNAAPYLDDLKQIWDQTYQDFELILVDDCSIDDTWKLLNNFKDSYQDRSIILARNKYNLGPGGSRNHGLKLCSGQYVIFLDSDDRYEPELLAKMAASLEQSGADMVCCGAMMHENDQIITDLFGSVVVNQVDHFNKLGGNSSPELLVFALKTLLFRPSLYPVPWNKMVRRDFLLNNNIIFPDFRLGEDKCWGFQLILKAHKIALVNEVLYHHILRPTSLSIVRSKRELSDIMAMLEFEFQLLTREQVFDKLRDTWFLGFWDTLFNVITRSESIPELQRQALELGLDFCYKHQLDYGLKQVPFAGRWGVYRLVPKSMKWVRIRAVLKEQYCLGRYLRRVHQLLAVNSRPS